MSNSMITEEDIRTKIIFPFLLQKGINKDDIFFEHTITIKLGRGENDSCILRGRTDVLVKNKQGQNLIIFEVKGPDVPYSVESRDQALSYARLVKGNLAPIVVVTNGHYFRCFYTIDGRDVESIPKDLDSLLSRSNSSIHDELRTQAIRMLMNDKDTSFIKYFFNSRLEKNITHLKGNIFEEKKYMPSIYSSLVDDDVIHINGNEKVFKIVGGPQSGKTNLMCHLAEKYLSNGCFCMFYSAYKLSSGLFGEIRKDYFSFFESVKGTVFDALLEFSKNNKIIIFIDGLNEVGFELRHKIIDELKMFFDGGVLVFISCSKSMLNSLDKDCYGNPTFLGDANNIKVIKVIDVGIKSQCHVEKIYEVYSNAYNVIVPSTHNKVDNPYVMRLAMEIYRNKTLPNDLNVRDVIRESIKDKISIIDRNLNIDSYKFITELARLMVNKNVALSESDACEILGRASFSRIDEIFINSGVLDRSDDGICFYYDSVRDYLLCEYYIPESRDLNSSIEEFILLSNKDTVRSAMLFYIRTFEKGSFFENVRFDNLMKLSFALIDWLELQESIVDEDVYNYINFYKGLKTYAITPKVDDELNRLFERFAVILSEKQLYIFSHEITDMLGHYMLNESIGSIRQLGDWEFLGKFELGRDRSIFHQRICALFFESSMYEDVDFVNYIIDNYNSLVNDEFKQANIILARGFISKLIDAHFCDYSEMCSAPTFLDIIIEDYDLEERKSYLDSLINLSNVIGGDEFEYIITRLRKSII